MVLMIKTKKDLKYFLIEDQKANYINKRTVMHFFPRCYKTLQATYYMRKAEYYFGVHNKLLFKFYKFKMERLCSKLGMVLSVNVFGPGLRIGHPNGIVVAPKAKVGKNCFIHQSVTIGINENEDGAPIIGDNFVAGAGAKIIGNITIASDVCVGANAVVVKTIEEPQTTWGGTC